MSIIRNTSTYQKPQWVTLAEQLVIQAQRDLQQKRRRMAKEKLARHRLYGLEARVKIVEGHQGAHH